MMPKIFSVVCWPFWCSLLWSTCSEFLPNLKTVLSVFSLFIYRIFGEEYILDTNALPGVCVCVCVHVCVCVCMCVCVCLYVCMHKCQPQVFFFHSLTSVVHWMEYLNLIKPNLSIFSCALCKKLWPTPKVLKVFPIFSSRSFIVLAYTFKWWWWWFSP